MKLGRWLPYMRMPIILFFCLSAAPCLASEAYDTQIKNRVLSIWQQPQGLTGLSATLRFGLDRAGKLRELAIASHSGNEEFDESVVQAFRRASPFPPLPGDEATKYTAVELIFKSKQGEAAAEAPKTFGPEPEAKKPLPQKKAVPKAIP